MSECLHRERECVYVQSRRGGARVPRSKRQESNNSDFVRAVQDSFDEAVPTMVKPGAGLTQIDNYIEDTDHLFDTIFTAAPLPPAADQGASPPQQYGSVRRYQTDSDILDAYYIWLHPYFPILPPPSRTDIKDNPQAWFPKTSEYGFEPCSPASLAISVVLALLPHPDEQEPFHEDSIISRREAAHSLAKRTLERIESDSEISDSAVSPAQALVHGKPSVSRAAFHPQVPIELESVIALSILSVYEYAQRGNITKMRDRASQALITAMNMGLHERGIEIDAFAESRRRTWWMAYICFCQVYIVSSTPPAISLFDSRFTTSFPHTSDPEAWPFFIKSQQTILLATQFVADLGRAVDGQQDWQTVMGRMQELHNTIEPLISQVDSWSDTRPTADDAESAIAYSLKQMSKIKLNSARIKIHRYCAFYDIPVFSEKHCDLKKSTPLPSDSSDHPDQTSLGGSPQCGCSQTLPIARPPPAASISSPNSTSSLFSEDSLAHPFPFSSHESSRLCLKSALNIAEAFEALPLPKPTDPQTILTDQIPLLPRTMPSFACCAMQSAYALLMVYHKTWVTGQNNPAALVLLQRCETGLRGILEVLSNYSIAFEALGGMRDQIQAALDCLSLPD